jgi:hypothetical protein
MKKTVFVWILLLSIVFSLNSCNGATSESGPESPSLNLDELPTEELIALRDRIGRELSYFHGYTKQSYEELCDTFDGENPFPGTVPDEEWRSFDRRDYYRVFHMDPDSEKFHAPEVISKISTGALLNEVYDVLGAPHFIAEYIGNMGTSYSNTDCYAYAMYVLSDGTVLLIQYTAIDPKDYDLLNCNERIPNFESIRYRYESVECRWRQISKIEVLGANELLEKSFQNKDLYIRSTD